MDKFYIDVRPGEPTPYGPPIRAVLTAYAPDECEQVPRPKRAARKTFPPRVPLSRDIQPDATKVGKKVRFFSLASGGALRSKAGAAGPLRGL